MKILSKKTFAAAFFMASLSLFAEIKMPAIFSDNMVLQRDASVKVWGLASSKAGVEVQFAGANATTKADKDGKWSVELPMMKASKEPREMSILENDKLSKKIKNVLVGEVWLASGQSNMEWNVGNTDTAEATKKEADYPTMRYFKQRGDFASSKPMADCVGGKWVETTPNQVMGYSAVGFYFAEQLMKELDVPVAIIYAALGATPMNAWVPADKLDSSDAFKQDVAEYNKRMKEYNYAAMHKKWEGEVGKYMASRKEAVRARAPKMPMPSHFVQNEPIPEDPLGPRQLPAGSFNAKIAPIVGYALRGVIWYQGEGDAHTYRVADFEKNFTTLIQTWRELWNNKDMPFYFVQLTAHYRPHKWEDARDAQRKVSEKLNNAEMAVTVDVGSQKEIHPRSKKPVGVRLANIALKNIYKKNVTYPFSPKFKELKKNGSSAMITFESGKRKLVCKGDPRGFEILTPEGKWLPAIASFDGKYIGLKSPNAETIEGVRYLWKAWCGDDVCIFNEDGLPLAPFSTQTLEK